MEKSSHKNIRNNMKFVLFLSITIISREIVRIFMQKNNAPEILTTFLMFGGELFFGLSYFVLKVKNLVMEKEPKFMGIPLIFGVVDKKESATKIILYIIFASILDFASFVVINYILPNKISQELENSFLEIKLKPMQIIFSSVICYFIFKRAIYLHQKLSLGLIILSLIGIILSEIFFSKINEISKIEILKIFLILTISFIIISFADCLEKYLMDLNFCSQFKLLFIEGISGFVLTSIFYIIIYATKINEEENNQNGNIFLLIFLSILYFLLSGFLNAYRLTVIMKLSPMNRTTSDSFVDPFIMTYSIIASHIKYDISYMIISIFATFIIIFGCLVYNEIIVLRFWGLDINTYEKIAERSNSDKIQDYEFQKTFSTSSNNSAGSDNND